MSKFRYAIPESIRPLLIVNKITSVEKLIDYVENHPKKFFPEMYATFLWQNIMEKEVFFYYQLHVYDGKLPFLLNFHPLTQRKFLHLGIFDEETLKAFVRKNQLTYLISKDHSMYDFVYSIVANDAKSTLGFFEFFSVRTKNALKQNGIYNKKDLMAFVEKTKLIHAPRIGKKVREEILRYLEEEVYNEIEPH